MYLSVLVTFWSTRQTMKLWKLAVAHPQNKSVVAAHFSDVSERLSSSQPELTDLTQTVQGSEKPLSLGQGKNMSR